MSARYAIYYAPKPDDPFGIRAAQWLGRNPFSCEKLLRPNLAELSSIDLDEMTRSPRHYGFHATLKAPFELHSEKTEAELIAQVKDFCARREGFVASIAPRTLGAFIAFQLTSNEVAMHSLHEAVVRHFEPFRAQLSDADMIRRRKAQLSVTQEARLLEFGYPYIFDEFRFHMTLTSEIIDAELRNKILDVLAEHFRDFIGEHHFWGLSIFKQAQRDADFNIIHQSSFGGW
ncbi:MAG: phosphonate metabolism protein [Hyphomonadaceae bacterium]|nr:MAG: phosphonate metabolism protein [Hyphomonadaceae bacterium]KAF0183646.1 MAG: phosphonate metabolism protein [Hyphomonadaceae bacterium]